MEENILLAWAQRYVEAAIAVFPVNHMLTDGTCSCGDPAKCKSPGKHPLTTHGVKDASLKAAQLIYWWTATPDANIALATGAVSGGLFVVDVDPAHGGIGSLRLLMEEHPEIPFAETLTVKTGGGGFHYYFWAPPGYFTIGTGVYGPGIDVRCDGGYVVAPPSNHASGTYYEFLDPEAPILEWNGPPPQKGKASRVRNGAVSDDKVEPILEGYRSDTLASLAGSYRAAGLSDVEIWESLKVTNAVRCQPPLDDDEVETIAASISRYKPGRTLVVKKHLPAAAAAKKAAAGEREPATYSNLIKVTTDPPEYLLTVNDLEVILPASIIMDHLHIKRAIYLQTNLVVPSMRSWEWDDELKRLVAEEDIAPEDASERGIVWSVIRTHLLESSEDESKFCQGRPVTRDGLIYTDGNKVRAAVKAAGLVGHSQESLWRVARSHGAVTAEVTLDDTLRPVWVFPS